MEPVIDCVRLNVWLINCGTYIQTDKMSKSYVNTNRLVQNKNKWLLIEKSRHFTGNWGKHTDNQ